MPTRFLTPMQLHRRLAQHGHASWPDRGAEINFPDVLPSPDVIITIGVDPDATLKPAYRERYFACVKDEEDRSLAAQEPKLALVGSMAIVAEQSPATCDFVGGPFRWLLARLQCFRRILLWPDSQYRDPDGNEFVRGYLLEGLPCLRQWLNDFVPATGVGAIALDLAGQRDCQVFWEVAQLVGTSHENFFVSDEDASEAYLLHHHDKVVVSIPDQHTRWLCLEELAEWSNLFEDWSG